MTGLRMTEAMSWKVVVLLKPATTRCSHMRKNLQGRVGAQPDTAGSLQHERRCYKRLAML